MAQTLGTANVREQRYDYYTLTDLHGQGRLAALTLVDPSGPSGLLTDIKIQEFLYQYDAVGNVLEITDTVPSQVQTYTYDHLNRLASAAVSGLPQNGGLALESYTCNTGINPM